MWSAIGKELPLAQTLDERPVHVLDVLLEDVIEIAHRLVEVDAEDEVERVQLVALREAEPPRHVAGRVRPDSGRTRFERRKGCAGAWSWSRSARS